MVAEAPPANLRQSGVTYFSLVLLILGCVLLRGLSYTLVRIHPVFTGYLLLEINTSKDNTHT